MPSLEVGLWLHRNGRARCRIRSAAVRATAGIWVCHNSAPAVRLSAWKHEEYHQFTFHPTGCWSGQILSSF
uniref:Uncharacterized protein n=1 Tax=Arundo donax TaxID=35708 RepID=A0A0A8ZEW7_ARUDO